VSDDEQLGTVHMRTKANITDRWETEAINFCSSEEAFIKEVNQAGTYEDVTPFLLSATKMKHIRERLKFVDKDDQREWSWVDSTSSSSHPCRVPCQDVSAFDARDVRDMLAHVGVGEETLLKLWEMNGAALLQSTATTLKVAEI
jgi:hypothetical protein